MNLLYMWVIFEQNCIAKNCKYSHLPLIYKILWLSANLLFITWIFGVQIEEKKCNSVNAFFLGSDPGKTAVDTPVKHHYTTAQ